MNSTAPRPLRLPLRTELADATPYGAPQLDLPVRLNVNENPYPPPSEVVEAIAEAVRAQARGLHRYPDREAYALRVDLGRYLAQDAGQVLEPARIWAANGSNEVMTQLLGAFGGPGHTVVSFTPSYSMYPEYARNTHTRWVAGTRTDAFGLDMDHVRQLVARERPAVIVLASPNNPTGTALPIDQVAELGALTAHSGPDGAASVVVIDEAYGEFRRTGTPSALSVLDAFAHMVVTRTMSKAFALAGARIGYLAASREVVDAVRVVRLPYHLSAVTQAVARAALAHREVLLAHVDQLRVERDRTVDWLREQTDRAGNPLVVADSDANFVMFGCFADRHSVWQGLVDRGVLIREVGPEGWLRVSIGTDDEMGAFRRALKEVAL